MLVPALFVAFAYWITWLIDGILGWQTMTRPIVLGTVIGLLCGDLKTGVIMGASLEAVYMGISGIGGSLAADYRSGTAVGVASRSCPGSPWRRALQSQFRSVLCALA